MKKQFVLTLDDETIARLEALGARSHDSAQGNEILGMALIEAFQERNVMLDMADFRPVQIVCQNTGFNFGGKRKA